ncbi:hypothetical protein DFJ63DRAFT_229362 [Scheffersomyces coipomensis]|uniref:uncharacterized protein n=1 Tax=Scheffersomyces coipomensis TaxID=1788519 RepID=UPI00315CEF7B
MPSTLSTDILVDPSVDNDDIESITHQPPLKRQKLDQSHKIITDVTTNTNDQSIDCDVDIDKLFNEMTASIPSPNDNEDGKLDDEINRVLSTLNDFNEHIPIPTQQEAEEQTSSFPSQFHDLLEPLTSTSSIKTGSGLETDNEGRSPFDSVVDGTNQTDESNTTVFNEGNEPHLETKINVNTVMTIKQSMINTSKLISLFTTLKMTYLKLCKEFNYLLQKFNQNETIKIELIHENNELRKLLMEIIKDREIERKDLKAKIVQLELLNKKSMVVNVEEVSS